MINKISYKAYASNVNNTKNNVKDISFSGKDEAASRAAGEIVNRLAYIADNLQYGNGNHYEEAFFRKFERQILPMMKKYPDMTLEQLAESIKKEIGKRVYS